MRQRRSLCRRIKLVVPLCLAGVVLGAGVFPPAGQAERGPGLFIFSGWAAAQGVRVSVTVPGAPATDNPIDGGGPTAQAALDSIGSSTGYAAFPDPGGLIVAAPGLAAGVLSGGAGGLPPIFLPETPNYPLSIQSDKNAAPSQSMGSGPYRLTAESNALSSRASAASGFETDVFGNAALLSAQAAVIAEQERVVSRATSDAQALAVGPLVFGQVKSTAEQVLSSDGALTPSTSLEIAGARVGGIPVSLTPDGVILGNTKNPAPVNKTVADVLAPSGIKVQIVSAQEFPDRVIAPALQITIPHRLSASSTETGTITITLGGAMAALSGAGPAASDEGGVGITPVAPTEPEAPTDMADIPTRGDVVASTPASGSFEMPGWAEVDAGLPGPSVSSHAAGQPGAAAGGLTPSNAVTLGDGVAQAAGTIPAQFGVGGIYLILTAAALTAGSLLLGGLIRILGART